MDARKTRTNAALKQARYRQRRDRDHTQAQWVDVGERVYAALATMPGGDDPKQKRANLSELLDYGAAWYLDKKNSVTR